MTESTEVGELAAQVRAVLGDGPTAVLTGAGLSTDSGIPDYRGPDSPPRQPMTYQQFVGDASFRRHYWARNHVGWHHMRAARPNPGHRALVALERRGQLTGVITQNVDTLHEVAGSHRTIDLHGRYDRVICLSCRQVTRRAELADRLRTLNPDFSTAVPEIEIAPDADAAVGSTEGFRVADCVDCAGILKPDIVYFGENVPKARVARCYATIDAADALLVAGSSLTVWSGLRFVKYAARQGKPVVLLNRGPTRGDPWATLRIDAGCSPVLTALAAG
ncbi:NAD-dependent protein deacetylase [Spiractinospora alimapuensis]|uniref:NAD-dependent protein deacetylase n=1 Tax=Spiractinospora alimapuensis TaxID=2820884 RepID=UPI001F276D3D|nr:NAD-dependent protein deacetylase [Spiractinospora alimapuensis]QVQ54788.1 NAD-dependent protein deacetylase [Spiractinospora alimapuensis]